MTEGPTTPSDPDVDDFAALEIGRAILVAQRTASAIIADAERQAASLRDTEPRAESPSQVAGDRVARPAPELQTLVSELDEIERVFQRGDAKVIRLLEEVGQSIGGSAREPSSADWDPPTDQPVRIPSGSTATWAPPQGEPVVDVEMYAAGAEVRVALASPPEQEARETHGGHQEQAEPAEPEEKPDARISEAEARTSGISSRNRAWLVNAVAAGVVIVVLVIALLLVNTI